MFERWATTELAPHIGGDGKRIGRKDGGQYVQEQFERRIFPCLGHTALVDVRKADVLAILDAAKADRATGAPLPWIFPNSNGSGPVCIKSFGKQLADRQRSADRRLANRTKSVDVLVMTGGR